MKPRLVLGRALTHHTPKASYLLNVYGSEGELIMWCGPMTQADRAELIEIFRKAGWSTRV